jgi:hypothetical protein
LGKYKLSDSTEVGSVKSPVHQFILNPRWNINEERYAADVALIVLVAPVEFTNRIIPICIYPQQTSHKNLVSRKGFTAGFKKNNFINFIYISSIQNVRLCFGYL